jgi:hypothetical protein
VKKLKKYFLLLLILGFYGCGESEKAQLLVGKWKLNFDKESVMREIPPKGKEIYNKLPKKAQEMLRAKLIKQANTNMFNFGKDNSFELRNLENVVKGTWALSKDGSKIVIQYEKGEREELIVKELTKEKLVILHKDTADKNYREKVFKHL